MKLSMNLFRLGAVVLTGMLFSMCSTDEGVSPNDDGIISSRGLLTGGSSTNVALIGLSAANELVSLQAGPPATETAVVPITGLREGETILGIDVRTKTGELYGLSSQSIIYKLDATTGVATPVGAPFTPLLEGTIFGFDINPADDVIRVMSNKNQNLRISATTGQVVAIDPFVNFGGYVLNSIAYLPILSAGRAILYDLDVTTGALYKQTNANGGPLTYLGLTGFNWSGEGGFDISANAIGYTVQYGSIRQSGSGTWGADDTTQDAYRLYTVNLKNGKATSFGKVRPMIGVVVK